MTKKTKSKEKKNKDKENQNKAQDCLSAEEYESCVECGAVYKRSEMIQVKVRFQSLHYVVGAHADFYCKDCAPAYDWKKHTLSVDTEYYKDFRIRVEQNGNPIKLSNRKDYTYEDNRGNTYLIKKIN